MCVMPPPVDHDAPLKTLLWGLSIPLNVIIAEHMLSLRHSWLRRQALRARPGADALPDMSSCTLNPHLYTASARQQSLREYVRRVRELHTNSGGADDAPDANSEIALASEKQFEQDLKQTVVTAFYRGDAPETCFENLTKAIEGHGTALIGTMLWCHVCFPTADAYSGVIPDGVV